MRPVLWVALALLLASTGVARTQEPVYPIDLRADRIEYRLLSEGLEIEISAYFTIYSSHAVSAQYWQYLSIYLGEGETCCYPPYFFQTEGNSCGADIECGEPCQMTLMDGSANIKTPLWMNCGIWHTWSGAGCDPFDPARTCLPLDVCACGAQYVVTVLRTYNGESQLRLVLDNTYNNPGAGMIEEADETNNSCTALIGSVDVAPTSWGAIKSLF